MWIRKVNQGGVAAKATAAFKSGQIVVLTPKANQEWSCAKSSATGDVNKRWGIGYYDPNKRTFENQSRVRNASLTSMEIEDVAVDDVVAVLSGEVEGSTNQIADGTYSPGDKLTVDWANAVLRKALTTERVYFIVTPTQRQVRVASKDNQVEVRGNIPSGYETLP